jgi:hypothetical protein
VLATLNADSEQDKYKFVMDLQESIFEMDSWNVPLEKLNCSSELSEVPKSTVHAGQPHPIEANKDSVGLAMI